MFTYFNNHQFENYLIAFGSFFSNIEVHRTDSTAAEEQRLVVPIEYAPKDRWYARLKQDPDFLKGVSVVVPRMSFELDSLMYDNSRKVNTLDQLVMNGSDPQQSLARLYVGVPYNLSINLNVLVKFQQDGYQIIEQILPYFTPELAFKMSVVPALGIPDQIPLVLNSITESDSFDGDFEHRREIIWTLNFTMKVNFYGPVKQQSRIREIVVNIWNTPAADILTGPSAIVTEDLQLFELENGSGIMMSEDTANTYLSVAPTVKIDAVANTITGNTDVTITENLTQ